MAAQYAEKIAQNWIGGVEPGRKNPRLWSGTFTPDDDYIGGVNTRREDAPRALYSYGPHYPVAIEEPGQGYWVNETPYYINEQDRVNCDYYGGLSGTMVGYYRPRRKATPSPTTKGHREAVEEALRRTGYTKCAIVKKITTEGTEGDPLEHTFRFWSR